MGKGYIRAALIGWTMGALMLLYVPGWVAQAIVYFSNY